MTDIKNHHFVLAVADAQKTADFFVQAMGFTATPVDDDGWRFISKNNFMIMLGSCPGEIPPSELGDHSYFAYFEVEDVDIYYEEIVSSGLARVKQPEDKPWNMREFPLTTPDGHRIMIGQKIAEAEGR